MYYILLLDPRPVVFGPVISVRPSPSILKKPVLDISLKHVKNIEN